METLSVPTAPLASLLLVLTAVGCSTGEDARPSGPLGTEPGAPMTTGLFDSEGITADFPVESSSSGDDGLGDTGGDGSGPSGCNGSTAIAPLGSPCVDDCACASGHCFALPFGGVCSECVTDDECASDGGTPTCAVDGTTEPPFAHCTDMPAAPPDLASVRCEDLHGTSFDAPAKRVHEVTIAGIEGTTNKLRRREQVRISEGLANELGIHEGEVDDTGPAWQVRVILDDVDPGSSANFSVAEIVPGVPELRVEVWLPNDVDGDGNFSDEHNGFHKLFGDENTEDVLDDEPKATVVLMAPGTTVVVSGGQTTAHVHFPEPSANDGSFRECVELHDDVLAVVAPHGGSIEEHITNELPQFLSTLEALGQAPSTWEAVGLWDGGGAYRRWHITATQVSAGAFPGYALLADAGPYKYTLSLHGFANGKKGVVVGGRAGRQLKCFLVQRLEQERTVGTNVLYEIHAPGSPKLDVNGHLGESGLSGQSTDNIVNRLSPADPGAGGIQLELSTALRDDDELFADFMHALAIATNDLIDLQLTDDPDTDYCSMLD
ncbi:poly-gamma-glutamate hydrolase family protein [Paraliomyxa miuraensis]|uniref:poly-gamma-glutamate hydrolase family protein n=1 Tax=Paraliomyxa miuraensis TaxID=376150 RepID=UPI0022519DE9|nr:poly-gamma-glutamate hydrolase family protein [Paraliomyxa miuraensis]MCX4247064.1 poly-gamma-glutamate hydrolase family protein [Paraliomyxa miuraensis]